jgi:hypothetical protein
MLHTHTHTVRNKYYDKKISIKIKIKMSGLRGFGWEYILQFFCMYLLVSFLFLLIK